VLDFFWVRDDERVTPKLLANRRLGGLGFEEFGSLDYLWSVLRRNGIRVEYMEDARLSAAQVLTALRIASKLALNDAEARSAYVTFRAVLRAAKATRAGVATLAD